MTKEAPDKIEVLNRKIQRTRFPVIILHTLGPEDACNRLINDLRARLGIVNTLVMDKKIGHWDHVLSILPNLEPGVSLMVDSVTVYEMQRNGFQWIHSHDQELKESRHDQVREITREGAKLIILRQFDPKREDQLRAYTHQDDFCDFHWDLSD